MLWLGLAVTSPLFGVPFFRYETLSMEIPAPVYSLVAILGAGSLSILMHGGRIRKPFGLKRYEVFGVVCFLFLVWHVTSLFSSVEGNPEAFSEVVKLAGGFSLFWAIFVLFPRELEFLERFWAVVLWATTALLLYLGYRSLIAGNPFLSTDLVDVSAKGGTNHLGLFMAVISPYAFFYMWGGREKLKAMIPLAVTFFAVVYVAIRATWLSVGLALLYGFSMIWRSSRMKALKLVGVFVVGPTLMVIGVMWFLSIYTDQTLAALKFAWFVQPEAVPQFHTFEERWIRVQDAWQGFSASPLLGAGLRNLRSDSHNDYVRVLGELGLPGAILFLALLACVYVRIMRRFALIEEMSWMSLATQVAAIAMAISLNFVTAYTAPHFWVFLGLFVVTIETDRELRVSSPLAQVSSWR